MRTIYDYKIEDYKPAMGKRLRTYREKSNLTQENMAQTLQRGGTRACGTFY